MILAEKIMGFVKTIIGAFASFWQNIIGWLQKAITKITQALKKAVNGASVFAQRIGEKFKEISKYYSKNGTVWEEYVLTKEVSEDEVPDFIRAMETTEEIDISEELEMKLSA